ncbi:hypothetical protein PR048_004714 [Dryococelus australis]|uniref:Uncharacterized protein n=1 Tax=Dryococelus australis TaxID=614101 RepID=A0ABQ9I799_9NEOP|nr:hypothetical protein PR048_004714 [Dryococelus australis]
MTDCKEKLNNILNRFVRFLKTPQSGSSAKAKKPFYLNYIMQFVLPYVRPVQHSHTNKHLTSHFVKQEKVMYSLLKPNSTDQQMKQNDAVNVCKNGSALSDTNSRQFKIKTVLLLEDLLTQQRCETTCVSQQTLFIPSMTRGVGFATTLSPVSCTYSSHQSVNYSTNTPNVRYTDKTISLHQFDSTHPF